MGLYYKVLFAHNQLTPFNLKYFHLGEETSKHNLHIMSDCVISMPISIGLEKNSPLKPRIDEFIQRVVEAGLIHKWLGDVMDEVRRRNFISSTEQVCQSCATVLK